MVKPLVIMPVKDALQAAEQSLRAVAASGYSLTVYDDYSTPKNAAALDEFGKEFGFPVLHLSECTDHPSPNYRWVLIDAQRRCLKEGRDLVIIESDVTIRPDTIERLMCAISPHTGMVAAVTTDEQGKINFPYEYARGMKEDGACKKRLSFCCTLLTMSLLQRYDFAQLDETKNWYDISISRISRRLGLENILQVCNPVLHKPHSSRPWKQLKYTNPFLYYWRKLIHGRDKI